MTDSERRMWRLGLAVGAMVGLAAGLLLALFAVMRPGLVAALTG